MLISGDVYDRSVPPADMVELFNSTLEALAALTTVVFTAGNHDSSTRLGFGRSLFRHEVVARTDSLEAATPIPVRDRAGHVGAIVYGIPYLDPDRERVRLGSIDEPLERSHPAVMAAVLERIAVDIREGEFADENAARIVMAHAFVTGGERSDSEQDITVSGVDSVPASLFRLGGTQRADTTEHGMLDYVALGHLHSPQRIALENGPIIRYSGSPIAFSFSETTPKSSALLHVENGVVEEVEELPAPVERGLITIEGTLEEILSEAHTAARDKYVRALVTDPARPRDLAARIKAAFPHAMEVLHLAEGSVHHGVPEIKHRDGLEILTDFFAGAGGRSLSAEEKALIQSAWEESRE